MYWVLAVRELFTAEYQSFDQHSRASDLSLKSIDSTVH